MTKQYMDVCGIDFEVKTRDKSVVNSGDTNYGAIDLMQGIVYMNGVIPKSIRENTLIHEWLHGVAQNYGLDVSESIICAFASELHRNKFRITLKSK